uniref:Uncharacterized protein n=1 Tax=Candidatus Kentrum sp. MB TaxID=2138164 RepID=A0A451BAZ2_9GAMM|nr:MAG: hypothetical protein BECKMB1821I_GA0114274_10232 [Candidatus Kentron sp. MB]VFK75450.1 MAG: hypothetical protein BECKMB1821H_GA0114242_10232 [Candidatus Kentron sp. MB]
MWFQIRQETGNPIETRKNLSTPRARHEADRHAHQSKGGQARNARIQLYISSWRTHVDMAFGLILLRTQHPANSLTFASESPDILTTTLISIPSASVWRLNKPRSIA